MKMAAARKYKNDYSDILGIISYCKSNNIDLTFEMIEKAIVDLYGSITYIDKTIFEYVKEKIKDGATDYQAIRKIEEENQQKIIEINGLKNKIDESSIDDFLKNIK